jgi:hypothetical protein
MKFIQASSLLSILTARFTVAAPNNHDQEVSAISAVEATELADGRSPFALQPIF